MIYIDFKWLKFVIGQVVINVVKYFVGMSDWIELMIYQQEDKIVLEVRDYGVGIFLQDIKCVFDFYYIGENGWCF